MKKRLEIYEQLLNIDIKSTVKKLALDVSHDINNPLASVTGNAEMIEFHLNKHKDQIPEKLHSILLSLTKKVSLNSERVLRMSKNIALFSKTAVEDEMSFANLAEVINNAVNFMGTQITIKEVDKATTIKANKTNIKYVLVNIISASGNNVEITFTAPNILTISGINGAGIAGSDLALCKTIVENFQGQLSVENSISVLVLPVVDLISAEDISTSKSLEYINNLVKKND